MMQVHFDRETLALLKKVLVETEELFPIEARTSEIRVQLASGILTAAGDGERDPGRLRSAGLRGIDRRLPAFRASESSVSWLRSRELGLGPSTRYSCDPSFVGLDRKFAIEFVKLIFCPTIVIITNTRQAVH